jgi:dihydrodipicolinate synthase/N-acetylneuraminate lyase
MITRRSVLLGALNAALITRPTLGFGAGLGATFRGIYPIAWTTCGANNALDPDGLAAQVQFCERGRVPGLVWPQNASAWDTLSEEEWQLGCRTLLQVARGREIKIVIGVQNSQSDTAQSVRFAKSAAEQGAAGIISLPPHASDDDAAIAYYKAIGAATPLPLMAQAVGNMSVELIGKLYQQVPTLKAVKDEAGNPLLREKEIATLTSGHLADFSGGGGRTLLTEMYLGFSGCCPYVGLSDLYQKSFELWHAGQQKEAFEMLGRIAAFNNIPGANEYVLAARGVLPETTVFRKSGGGAVALPTNDEKQIIRESFDQFIRPYLAT